jgi:hypothetical protein
MDCYHKIDSVYLRDPATKHKTFLDGQWTNPAFGYLASNRWVFTEKIDGTNVRVGFDLSPETPQGFAVRFGGRTDEAQMPVFLMEHLQARFTADAMLAAFPDCQRVTLYGEGYGAKIQKHGEKYRADAGFILFDVRIGDVWLERANVEDIAAKLGIPAVPIIGSGTLYDAIDRAHCGFDSTCSAERRPAEGLVVRPEVELLDRRGNRIITKIKTKDFAHVARREEVAA